MKKYLEIFLTAFILNLFWENLHSALYASYQGGAITESILLRASLFDALIVSLIALISLEIGFFMGKLWLSLIFGAAIAIAIEYYALGTGRWAYNYLMPIIPYLNIGLTPAVQLGLTSYAVLKGLRYLNRI